MVADIVREGALTAQSKGHMQRGPSGMPEHVGSRSWYCSAGSGWCTLEPQSAVRPCVLWPWARTAAS